MAKTQSGEVQSATLFLATLPIYTILFVLELIILCHFVVKSHKLKIVKLFKQFAIILIVIILATFFVELWSILVDFSSKLPTLNGYCFVQMYARILSFILLEAIMFLFWIVRINQIFRFSAFALPQKFVRSIYIVIPTLVLASMVLLFINMDTKYYKVDQALNPNLRSGHGCIIEVYRFSSSKTVKAVLIIGQILAFSLNIFYGFLFYHKLHQFQYICATAIKASARDKNGKPNAIDILMQKHTLLAVISAICSIITYVIFNVLIFTSSNPSENIYAFQLGFLFIDIDMFIKSITMLFMFNLYTTRFFQWCWCCIKISAIDCTKRDCCSCCSEIDAKDFNHTVPLFLKLEKKTTAVRMKVEQDADDDKFHFDKKTYSSRDLDHAIGTEFYIVKKIPFQYYCVLVKVTVAENEQKIYHYARDGERLVDEESIFKQIRRHKSRKQSLTRHKNEQAKKGNFVDSNEKNIAIGVSGHNLYFRKSEGKYPFIVALKCNAHSSVENGDLIAQYILVRIEDEINSVKKIDKFEYEPLLEEIVNEVRTKRMNKNILFKRLHSPKMAKRQSMSLRERVASNSKKGSSRTSLSINMTQSVKNSSTVSDKDKNYISVAATSPIEEEQYLKNDDNGNDTPVAKEKEDGK